MPPITHWQGAASSSDPRHPAARGSEVIWMHACNADELIAVDKTRVTLQIIRNMRIMQALIGHFGHAFTQRRGAISKTDDTLLTAIIRAEALSCQMFH